MVVERNGDVILVNRSQFPIGRIKQDTLYLDSPPRHRLKRMWGVDTEVLKPNKLSYTYIVYELHKFHKQLKTSRIFFYNYGIEMEWYRRRRVTFIYDEWFTEHIAHLYDGYLDAEEALQKDLFDLADESDTWDLFEMKLDAYRTAVEQQKQFELALKFKRKLRSGDRKVI